MDFENQNVGLELLLAHMNLGDIIEAVERLCSDREDEEESGESLVEGLSGDTMDENELSDGSALPDLVSRVQNDKVRYGSVADLLAFVNMVSNTPASTLSKLEEELGVLLNKVRNGLFNRTFLYSVYSLSLCLKWQFTP